MKNYHQKIKTLNTKYKLIHCKRKKKIIMNIIKIYILKIKIKIKKSINQFKTLNNLLMIVIIKINCKKFKENL